MIHEDTSAILLDLRTRLSPGRAVADGTREVPGAEVTFKRVPETLPAELLNAIGATEAQKAFADKVGSWEYMVRGTQFPGSDS